MKVSLLAIGSSGVGKSTIGNMILTGQPDAGELHDGFITSDDINACTKVTRTISGTLFGGGDSIEVSYTDTPSIPDTADSVKTKANYDAVIQRIKTDPLSAILVVFSYARIDPDPYNRSALLFHEIQKAKCKKVLIVNDQVNRVNQPAIAEANLLNFVEIIKTVTGIKDYVFHSDCCFVDSGTMEEKLTTLVTRLHQGVQPVTSPDLCTSAELEKAHAMKKADDAVSEQKEGTNENMVLV